MTKPDGRANNGGRNLIQIDWKKVDDLLMAGCLGTEVAAYIGMHPNTFYDRVQKEFGVSFTEYFQEKKSKGESILRAHQYAKAIGVTDKGDNTLLIWLGKNRLGQKENHNDNAISGETINNFANLMKQLNDFQSLKKEDINRSNE